MAVSALGCAPHIPPETAREVQLDHPAEGGDAAPDGTVPAASAAPPWPDAWWHREIAEREARIEELRKRVEIAEDRTDEQPEDVKGRLEGELELEEESLDEFRQVSTKPYSGNMMGGGVVLIVVGGVSVLMTGYLAVLAFGPLSDFSERQREEAAVGVAALLSIGVSGVAVGVPLLAAGRKRVVKPQPTARLWVGPRELGVRGSF